MIRRFIIQLHLPDFYEVCTRPDSFKESMTATNAALAMEKGIKKVFLDAECVIVPMAEGGVGPVEPVIWVMRWQNSPIFLNILIALLMIGLVIVRRNAFLMRPTFL
jgi:hypothetical protein